MEILANHFKRFLGALLVFLLLFGCGGSGGGSSTPAGTGTLTTSLTDNSTEEYEAIYVTVERVDVHSDSGGWQTVAAPDATYNLLELVNGVLQPLGSETLDAGPYTQLRMILGDTPDGGLNILDETHPYANYFIDSSDLEVELKVPSGFNTGIKVVSGFTITENQTTELILDFDAMKSIVKAGSSGKYLLKPTIKVLTTVALAEVTGVVSADADGLGIEGALVSVQESTNDASVDAADQVTTVRSTITAADDLTSLEDETGEYYLALPAGNYNLVTYYTGYEPVCEAINPAVGTLTTVDFSLLDAATGTVEGTVNISSASVDQHVIIDFRQAGHCPDPLTFINVKTVQVAVEGGGSYQVDLPPGTYRVVSSTNNNVTQITQIVVSSGLTTVHNVDF